MAARLVCAVVVPLVLLGAVTGRQALDEKADAEQALHLADRITTIDRLAELYSALFSERLWAGVDARAAWMNRGSDLRSLFSDEDVQASEDVRARTDRAMTSLGAAPSPIDPATLDRIRQGMDGGAWSPSALSDRYDAQLEAVFLDMEVQVNDAERRAVELGDVELSESIHVLLHSIQTFGASSSVIADLANYWFTAPFESNLARSQLARSEERYRSASRLLSIHATGRIAADWSGLANASTRMDAYVVDALEGAASPLLTEGDIAGPTRALASGVGRTRMISELSLDASARVRNVANELAEDARHDAQNAMLLALGSTIASLLAALWFGRSIVLPVRRVTAHANQVGAGALDIDPLPLQGPPELVDASGAINELVANLQLMDQKAQALAACQFDAPVLAQPLPGRLGDSLHRSMRVLSGSIEERERLRSRLSHQATHDILTGIPNRAAAIEHLEAALARSQDAGSMLCLVFIDLDDFKEINDTHGHAVGDAVLRAMAQRMAANTRNGDMIARLGGDEFLLVAENLGDDQSAFAMAERMVSAIGATVSVDGHELGVGACAGVAFARAGDTPLGLLHHADLAVYRAKSRGSNHVDVYDDELEQRLRAKADVEEGLRVALKSNDQLRLCYQPLIEGATGRLRSVEALLRWDRPGDTVLPDEFIQIAEESNLIIEIDRWVLRTALGQLVRWDMDPGMEKFDIAVNISGRHVVDLSFVGDIATAIANSGIDAGRLILEVTETVLVSDLERAAAQLQAVRDLGVRIAVDDFGTGFTSLAHLRSLPIDEIKVDQSFVGGLPESHDDCRLIQIVIELARHLGVPLVAEGVETEGQRTMLAVLGCEFLQGYYFSKPLSPEHLTDWAMARFGDLNEGVAM